MVDSYTAHSLDVLRRGAERTAAAAEQHVPARGGAVGAPTVDPAGRVDIHAGKQKRACLPVCLPSCL